MDIPLALVNGGFTVITIDAETYPDVIRREWRRNQHGYATEYPRGPLLHRVVTRAPKGTHVHHQNFHRTDNRLANLQVLTPGAHLALHPRVSRPQDRPQRSARAPVLKIDLYAAWQQRHRGEPRRWSRYERGWRQDEQGRWKIDKKARKRYLDEQRGR